jgi:hypothetical protein
MRLGVRRRDIWSYLPKKRRQGERGKLVRVRKMKKRDSRRKREEVSQQSSPWSI